MKVVARPLMTLAVGVVGVAVWFSPVLVSRVRIRSLLAEIRHAGQPLRAADLERPAVPDGQNAFVSYTRAAGLMTGETAEYKAVEQRLRSTRPGEWSEADVRALRSFVSQNAQAVAVARQAAQLTHYKSNTDWSAGIDAKLGYFGGHLGLVRALAASARLDLVDGHYSEALKTCADALRLSALTGSEPSLITHLVELSCRATTMAVLDQAISASDDPAVMRKTMDLLEANPLRPRAKAALAAERAVGLTVFQDVREGRYTPSVARYKWYPGLLDHLLLKDQLAFLELMAESIRLADQPYYKIRKQAAALEPRLVNTPKQCPVTAILLPVATESFLVDGRARMAQEVVRSAAAVKIRKARHGAYPRELRDLVPEVLPKVPIDEFTGKPLIYKRQRKGFVVYSVGQNLRDDGGTKAKDPESGDIVHTE